MGDGRTNRSQRGQQSLRQGAAGQCHRALSRPDVSLEGGAGHLGSKTLANLAVEEKEVAKLVSGKHGPQIHQVHRRALKQTGSAIAPMRDTCPVTHSPHKVR